MEVNSSEKDHLRTIHEPTITELKTLFHQTNVKYQDHSSNRSSPTMADESLDTDHLITFHEPLQTSITVPKTLFQTNVKFQDHSSNRSSPTMADESLETDHFITIHLPTTPQPETVFQTKVNNQNLEELLDDIYRKKLQFHYNHREVKFIQNAIESFVLNIVTDLIDNRDDIFVGDVENLETNDESVLCKIGSFYERTKNTYPDQYDFVYVPFRISLNGRPSSGDRKAGDNCAALKPKMRRVTDRVDQLLQSGCMIQKDKEIGLIELKSFTQETKHILTLKFCFTRNSKQPNDFLEVSKVIHVNLTPGIRITDPNLMENVRSWCLVPEFQEHILETSSLQYLSLPYSEVSFCEAEVTFMLRELSSNHVKVYRLLKYLIIGDGNDDKELLGECLNTGDQVYFHISSYAIKTAIIVHHYKCADDNNIGQCILGILRWFQTKFDNPRMIVQKETDDEMCCMPLSRVEMTSLTNKPITMAMGNPRLVSEASCCLDTMISDLRRYRKKAHGHDSGVESFAARMTERVRKYDLDKRPLVRAVRHGQRAMKESGSCCYSLVILLAVVAFIIGLLFAFALTKK